MLIKYKKQYALAYYQLTGWDLPNSVTLSFSHSLSAFKPNPTERFSMK